jgi:hypothetical protein
METVVRNKRAYMKTVDIDMLKYKDAMQIYTQYHNFTQQMMELIQEINQITISNFNTAQLTSTYSEKLALLTSRPLHVIDRLTGEIVYEIEANSVVIINDYFINEFSVSYPENEYGPIVSLCTI